MSNKRLSRAKTPLLILFSFLNLLISDSFANETSYQLNKKTIILSVPNNWQHAYNFLNTPLTLFGPYQGGRRPIISITNGNVKDFIFNRHRSSENKVSYIAGRKKWLLKNKGSMIREKEYKVERWKHINEVHSLGHQYSLMGEEFDEQSYFFNCSNELYNISTLQTLTQKSKFKAEIYNIISSIKCL